MRARRRLAVALVIVAAISGCAGFRIPGTAGPVAGWCDTYQHGYSFVSSIVLPALEGLAAAGGGMAWLAPYRAALAALGAANGPIVGYCEQQAAGSRLSEAEAAPVMASGLRALADLIDVHKQALAAPPAAPKGKGVAVAQPPPRPQALVDSGPLARQLRAAEAGATAQLARRR